MSYLLSILRISPELNATESLSKEDWESCAIQNELAFIEKDTYPNHYLEVQQIDTKEFIPCFWLSKDFQKASIDSKVFMIHPEIEKYALHIASKINGIVMGEEGELFFIPGIGKIEAEKNLLEQKLITVMELKEQGFNLHHVSEIKKYIASISSKR